jgi:outer membrane protein
MIQKIFTSLKISFICLITLSFGAFTAHAQQVITLQKAVALTLERNLTIKQSQVTEQLGAEDVRQAKGNQLPTLSVNPQASYNFGRSPNLTTYSYTSQSFLYVNGQASVGVTLFQGGQLRNQVLENKLILDADKTSTEKVKNDLLLNVVVDYLSILTNQDLVAAANQQIDIAKITLDRAQKNFNAGNQTLADLSQAKAGLSTAELNLTTAQNQLESTILTLKQYMEMSPDSAITIEKPDISKLTDIKVAFNSDEVINSALQHYPDVRLAEVQEKGYEQAVKVAKGSFYPTLSFFGGVGSNYSNLEKQQVVGTTTVLAPIGTVQGTGQTVVTPIQQPIYSGYSFTNQFGNNFNQSLGVSLNIPIFNHSTASVNYRKAKLNYEYSQLSTQLAKDNLSKTISQALLDLKAAEKSYISAQQTYQANKDAFNTIKQRYDVGLVNSLDYNTALTNYDKAQNDMITAKYTLVFRSKVIDYYLGNPIQL